MILRRPALAIRVAAALLLGGLAAGCDRLGLQRLALPGSGTDPIRQLSSEADGPTQSTPLVVGQVVDERGIPVEMARVRVYEGLFTATDGTTQATPLDGTTQTTPFDGVTQSSPLDGTTQSTPFDGSVFEHGPDSRVTTDAEGRFALRAPGKRVLAVETWDLRHNRAARLGIGVVPGTARIDVGTLTLQPECAVSGRILAPRGVSVEGVAVFVPGTDHMTRTDIAGAFHLAELPGEVTRVAAVRPGFKPAVSSALKLQPGGTAVVPDLVLELERPVLKSVIPAAGGPGAEVVLTGEGFGHIALRPVDVRFNRLKAAQVTRVGDGEIRAVVPAGAQSGPVDVLVEGVVSGGLPFSVVASVSIGPEAVRQSVADPASFQVAALDDKGNAMASAPLSWSVDPPDLGTIDSVAGRFVAARPGFGTLTVSSGRTKARAALGFGEWHFRTVLAPANAEDPEKGPDEGQAGGVAVAKPWSMALLPGGDLAFSDFRKPVPPATSPYHAVVRTLSPNGAVQRLAGTGDPGYDGDGLALAVSRLGSAASLAATPTGGLAIADPVNRRIRGLILGAGSLLGRALESGKLWDLAGSGEPGPNGRGLAGPDGPGPLGVDLTMPMRVAWAPSGSLLFMENGDAASTLGSRLREVSQAGVKTLLDTKGRSNPESTGPIEDPGAFVAYIRCVQADAHGNVYFGTTGAVWMLCRKSGRYFGADAVEGQVVRIAGNGTVLAFNGEEGQARMINLWAVEDIAFLGSSMILIDWAHQRIREISAEGLLKTIAGSVEGSGDPSGLALGAQFRWAESLVAGQNGEFYLADTYNHRILEFTRR